MDIELYGGYIIHLIKCAILGIEPKPIPQGIEPKLLFDIARDHKVENIIYPPLCKAGLADAEVLRKFEEFYSAAITVDATQQYYLEQIIDAFEENRIRHLVMKGIVIKRLYPTTDMRQSVDLDIFVDDENTEKARDIMEELGFTTTTFDHALQDDGYIIDRCVHVEIHRQLISNKCPWEEKCQEIVDRIVPEDGYEYRYRMTIEDYYIHMIGHMAKHMKYSGMGLKMVLDVWVYLRHYKDKLDRKILDERLKYCGLYDFDQNVQKLCRYWFEDGEADELISSMARYILISGYVGTHEQLIATEMAENAGNTSNAAVSKFKFYMKAFFWPYKKMKTRYPILGKLPFLLPFCWVHRALKTLLFDKEKAQEIKGKYDNADMDYGKRLLEFKRNIGL